MKTPLVSTARLLVPLIVLNAEDSRTKSEVLSIAEMIARYIEDQFVLWSPVRVPKEQVKVLRHDYLTGKEVYPVAQEQYSYMRPISGSAADALWTFTAVARATGNRLWLAKACALGDVMTRTQRPDGELPTYWDDLSIHSTWLNCQVFCAQALLELAVASEVPGPNPKGKP